MFSYYLKSEQDAQYIWQIFNDLISPKLIESRNNLTEGSIILLLNDMGQKIQRVKAQFLLNDRFLHPK